MRFFSLEMKDFTAAASVHIYDDGRIVNKKDKDRNVYIYDEDGKVEQVIAPGSDIRL